MVKKLDVLKRVFRIYESLIGSIEVLDLNWLVYLLNQQEFDEEFKYF